MGRPIGTVLVANRGEIARRVFATCRRLGIGCVAVFSDADAGSPHVAEADAAVRLPGSRPAETYLRGELMVKAALDAGADAVHPGYGFLSESAGFARAVTDAGLTWVGPPAEAIAAMGSKIEAKRLMAAAGVPVLAELGPGAVRRQDLPVLIKASAGGGGRGMRVVSELAELPGELAAARSEAASAFGDPAVFCEPYLPGGRHIEVQLMADEHGTVLALGERECSIQRRHQKIVEEAPSPLVERTPGMRQRLFDAAIAAAGAVGYVGAGTVEFLAQEDGAFSFLEMNTRLQVEHPVTECTTGLDLVRMQLEVAQGAALAPEVPTRSGHAIEVRLYAEDPLAGWQPQSGRLYRLAVPDLTTEFGVLGAGDGGGIRLDSSVSGDSEISAHYDPMLAKVIGVAATRDGAARALAGALARAQIHGPVTNRELLLGVLRHPSFLAGDTDTTFLDRHGVAALAEPRAGEAGLRWSVLAAGLADAAANRRSAPAAGRLPAAWRNVVSQPQRKRYRYRGTEREATYRALRGGFAVEGAEAGEVDVVTVAPDRVVLDIAGVRRVFRVARHGEAVYVDSSLGAVSLQRVPRFTDPVQQAAPGSLLAPMPAMVGRVSVEVGQRVAAGQPLLWLEAMKMEHRVAAPADGVVAELRVGTGQQVEPGTVLAVVTAAQQEETA